jgi:hypothetical protein
VSEGDRRPAVALVDAAAFALGLGLVSQNGSRLALVALVASIGGMLFLGLGVIRRAGTPPSAGGW